MKTDSSTHIVAHIASLSVQTETAAFRQDEFVSMLHHELRTPLNGVVGMVDLLLETELSPAQREIVEIARDSAYSLYTILNELLRLAEIQARL